MGNRSRKKRAAAEFNAKRAAELERIERERAEYEAWAATPEGQATVGGHSHGHCDDAWRVPMTADLTPYRGKRALVFGPLWAVEDAITKLRNALVGVVHEHNTDVALALLDACNLAAIYGGATGSAAVRDTAKAAGIPVLRVRRDGTVEVDGGA